MYKTARSGMYAFWFVVSVVLATVPITERRLLYHDEIPTSLAMDDALRCISAGASWHFPNGSLVDDVSNTRDTYFVQRILSAESRLTRLTESAVATGDDVNGLWTCRLRGNETGAVPLAIYQRGRGKNDYSLNLLTFWYSQKQIFCVKEVHSLHYDPHNKCQLWQSGALSRMFVGMCSE